MAERWPPGLVCQRHGGRGALGHVPHLTSARNRQRAPARQLSRPKTESCSLMNFREGKPFEKTLRNIRHFRNEVVLRSWGLGVNPQSAETGPCVLRAPWRSAAVMSQ